MDFAEFKAKYQKAPVVEYRDAHHKEIAVSVCVQTYQQVDFIAECLDGILRQETDFGFNILIGDDCSTDGTREICIEYADKYSGKVRLFLHDRGNNIEIYQQPTGRFNFLYNLYSADGEYVAICEGDDYWTDPSKLQKQVDYLRNRKDFAGCFHDTWVKYQDGSHATSLFRTDTKLVLGAEDTIASRSPFHTSSFLFRRMDLNPPKSITKFVSADMFIFSLVARNGKLGRLPEVMSVYRKHESGITKNRALLKNQQEMRIELISELDRLHDFKYSDKAESVIRHHETVIRKMNSRTRLLGSQPLRWIKSLMKKCLLRLIGQPKRELR